ncbi:MAG: DJ-1/PfpI family protein [Gammaproteobacteria bacterium]|nr:DJ-1/PfpI family protein [Gammaproteobacteria bacterium]
MTNALVPLAQGCEELEAITITDLLVRAGINVTTAGLDDQPVTASRGMRLLPDTTIDKLLNNTYDLVVLPGGLPGADHLRDNPHVQQILKQHAANHKLVAAICAAPKALAAAGLLDNKTVTCYPGALSSSPLTNTTVNSSAIEIDGNIITSRGPGTAMDFALTLIELLEGKEKRLQINQQLVR